MSDKYASLRQEILNPAIGSRDHLRKIALQLLDELADREADKARIAELTHNHRVHAAKLISERGLLKQRIAELEARIEPQEPIAWIVHALTGNQLTQDGDYVANAEGMANIHSTPLYSAPPVQSVQAIPVMYKGMEMLKKDGLELIRDGLAEATELESMCMAGALLSATPAQPVAVPVRYMNRYTGACYTLEQQPDAATDTMVYVPLFDIAQPVAVPVDLYKIANHIASAKGGLPDEWQDWAEEIETDIRRAAMLNQAPVKQPSSNEGQP